jgi:hypothetical protein
MILTMVIPGIYLQQKVAHHFTLTLPAALYLLLP